MKITVRIKPNARKNEVIHLEGEKYIASVTAPPVDGAANEKLIELLAHHFGRPKGAVTILRGEKSKNKLIEIS